MRNCPYCDERIQNKAVVCKHCGADVDTNDGFWTFIGWILFIMFLVGYVAG